ncbi:hypothetical protein ACFX2H_013332 [Malus domestica]
MGPVRGVRKRKKAKKNDSPADGYCEENASVSGSSEKEGLVDWWDEASRRINVLHLTTVWANIQMAKLLNPTSFKAIFHFIANRSKIVKKKNKRSKLRIVAAIFEWFTKQQQQQQSLFPLSGVGYMNPRTPLRSFVSCPPLDPSTQVFS